MAVTAENSHGYEKFSIFDDAVCGKSKRNLGHGAHFL
jgi:hypothetical protein